MMREPLLFRCIFRPDKKRRRVRDNIDVCLQTLATFGQDATGCGKYQGQAVHIPWGTVCCAS